MISLIVIGITALVVGISIAAKSKGPAGVEIGSKMIHGVLLPLAAFIACTMLFALCEIFRGPDSGMLVLPFSFIVLFASPVIVAINSLMMLPKWRKRETVWLVGSILPACLFIGEFILFFGYWKI